MSDLAGICPQSLDSKTSFLLPPYPSSLYPYRQKEGWDPTVDLFCPAAAFLIFTHTMGRIPHPPIFKDVLLLLEVTWESPNSH